MGRPRAGHSWTVILLDNKRIDLIQNDAGQWITSGEAKGYIATKYKEAISYAYADVLKVDPIAKPRRVVRIKTTGRKPNKLTEQQMAALKASLSRSRKR